MIVGCAVLACAKSHPQTTSPTSGDVPPTPTIAFDKSVSEAIEATNGGIVEAAVADGRLWLRTHSGVMAVRFADGGMEEHFPLGIVDLHRTTDGQLWILGAQKDGNAVLERWNGAWTDAVRVPMDNPLAMGELDGQLYVLSSRELVRAPEWLSLRLSDTLRVKEADVVSAGTANGEAIYVGGPGTLYRIDSTGHVSTLAGRHATALITDSQPACVIAADGNSIVRVCGNKAATAIEGKEPFFSLVQAKNGIFASAARVIISPPDRRLDVPHFRRTGGVWIGSLPGLLVIPADDGILLAPL